MRYMLLNTYYFLRCPITGPLHAQSGSYYMYVESSNSRNKDTARIMLQGDDFNMQSEGCLRFYYTMNGFHCGSLSVFSRRDDGPSVAMWSLSGDQHQNWHKAAIDFSMSSDLQVTNTGWTYVQETK